MPTLPSWQGLDMQVIGTWVAAILTLGILSAALCDNRISRVAFGLLIGIAVGFTAAITWWSALWPRVQTLWRDPLGQWPLLIWFALGLLLLARGLKWGSWLSNMSLAYLIGVGTALAIAGAALGTAVPQFMAILVERSRPTPGTWEAIVNPLLVALGTAGVLLRFSYTATGEKKSLAGRLWSGLVRTWGKLGYAFMVVAIGALFATAIVSLLTLLSSRIDFLLVDWLHLTPH